VRDRLGDARQRLLAEQRHAEVRDRLERDGVLHLAIERGLRRSPARVRRRDRRAARGVARRQARARLIARDGGGGSAGRRLDHASAAQQHLGPRDELAALARARHPRDALAQRDPHATLDAMRDRQRAPLDLDVAVRGRDAPGAGGRAALDAERATIEPRHERIGAERIGVGRHGRGRIAIGHAHEERARRLER
jgi:hypothetical protein